MRCHSRAGQSTGIYTDRRNLPAVTEIPVPRVGVNTINGETVGVQSGVAEQLPRAVLSAPAPTAAPRVITSAVGRDDQPAFRPSCGLFVSLRANRDATDTELYERGCL